MENQIIIQREWCKSCGICIALCPEKVFASNLGQPEIVHPEKCIGCKSCEYHCPDFAIRVWRAL